MYYYRARYYDSNVGRFLQVDPNPGIARLPLSVTNRYIYAFNNPIRFTDPNGELPFLAVLAISSIISATVTEFLDDDNNNSFFENFLISFGTGLITAGVGRAIGFDTFVGNGIDLFSFDFLKDVTVSSAIAVGREVGIEFLGQNLGAGTRDKIALGLILGGVAVDGTFNDFDVTIKAIENLVFKGDFRGRKNLPDFSFGELTRDQGGTND